MKMFKIFFIKLLIHIPFSRNYAWQMYAKILANAFADSVNRAEEIRKGDMEIYEKFPEFKVLNYTMAMLPVAMIAYHVGQLTNEPDWLTKHLKD